MLLKLVQLELKSFFRSKSLGTNLGGKILVFFLTLYIVASLFTAALGGYEILKSKFHLDPLQVLCKSLLYFIAYDLFLRYMLQQLSIQNIKPFLELNMKKKTLVQYTLLKSFGSFFCWGWLFFFLPYSVRLVMDGANIWGVIGLNCCIIFLLLINNFLNFILNSKGNWVYSIAGTVTLLAVLDYFKIFSFLKISETIFYTVYQYAWLAIIPLVFAYISFYLAYRFVLKSFYLDEGLEKKTIEGKTENIAYLDRYGVVGTFINNDIRLLKRNKLAKNILYTGIIFLFYGLLFLSSDTYKSPYMMVFLGLFITGGFQFSYGQNIPSLDSSYFPLMMTLNVPFKDYLNSKWMLMNIATIICLILGSFYIYFSWTLYLSIIAGAIYNLGVNSQIILLGGAFNKIPLDLNSNTKSLFNKNSFNIKSLLLLIPQLLIPILIFGIGNHFLGIYVAILLIAIIGVIGLLLKKRLFNYIEKLYKKEKYSMLIAFKQDK
ncbi:DUF5687 family protein [Elizabethkingia sp. JS20170427COW]|uniref:DUF5687 family protein n=1 Tax=Elizabethkingia sp. JS20170427COW TaxID=2583851 RepID=UPI001110F812|nr:DUF5687 family protein [Elizabethkingia sp. JS20170427COW]QCX53101.1 hypothetical protein FGE20_04835 [Elizabethkingia sp. JS20170427COW]